MTRWWMSFADTSRPQGSQFLGVVIVEAADPAGATKKAWALGINPGGQIQFMQIDESCAAALSFDLAPFSERLLGPDEARALSDRIDKESSS